MKTRDTNFTLEQVLEAVEKGVTKTGAAKVLGCAWNTVDGYSKRWASVDQAFRVKRRELVDLSEMGLRRAILSNEAWAISFALRTLGKEEGYAERYDIKHSGGVEIRLGWGDDGTDDT